MTSFFDLTTDSLLHILCLAGPDTSFRCLFVSRMLYPIARHACVRDLCFRHDQLLLFRALLDAEATLSANTPRQDRMDNMTTSYNQRVRTLDVYDNCHTVMPELCTTLNTMFSANMTNLVTLDLARQPLEGEFFQSLGTLQRELTTLRCGLPEDCPAAIAGLATLDKVIRLEITIGWDLAQVGVLSAAFKDFEGPHPPTLKALRHIRVRQNGDSAQPMLVLLSKCRIPQLQSIELTWTNTWGEPLGLGAERDRLINTLDLFRGSMQQNSPDFNTWKLDVCSWLVPLLTHSAPASVTHVDFVSAAPVFVPEEWSAAINKISFSSMTTQREFLDSIQDCDPAACHIRTIRFRPVFVDGRDLLMDWNAPDISNGLFSTIPGPEERNAWTYPGIEFIRGMAACFAMRLVKHGIVIVDGAGQSIVDVLSRKH